MTEIATKLGENRNLIGIVSAPDDRTSSHAVLLVNAGMLHRAGPNRLYVEYARRLAAHGVYACRFDLGGIGDSPPRQTTRGGFRVEGAMQVTEVMTSLSIDYGITTFALFGICSGGDVAVEVASRDGRVRAAVVVNAGLVDDETHCRRLDEFQRSNMRRLHRRKLRSVASWKRLLTGKSHTWSQLGTVFGRTKGPADSCDDECNGVSSMSAKLEVSATGTDNRSGVDWPAIFRNGCRILILHSECSVNLDAYRAAARAPRSRLLAQRVLPRTDHGFTPLSSHDRLFEASILHLL